MVILIVAVVTIFTSPIFVLATQGVSRRGRRGVTAAIVAAAVVFGAVTYHVDPRMAGVSGQVFLLMVAPLTVGWLVCWLLQEAVGLWQHGRGGESAPNL